jgi:hypothetical protein
VFHIASLALKNKIAADNVNKYADFLFLPERQIVCNSLMQINSTNAVEMNMMTKVAN